MKDILILKDLEQIKAIMHPYRIEILECFHKDEPATAKQIADKIGEPHAKINYHIKTLQKAGILDLVDERVKSGIIEKYYLPAAKTFVINKVLINMATSFNQEDLETFENITKDFYEGMKTVNKNERIAIHYDCYLTDEEAKALKDRLYDTIQNFMIDKCPNKKENTKAYSVASFLLPKCKE